MAKRIHLGRSPLSNTIYAGSVAKDGQTWLSDKTDVTQEAIAAVAEHIGAGYSVTLSAKGRPTLQIEVSVVPSPTDTKTGEV